jgi:hypothetical protein
VSPDFAGFILPVNPGQCLSTAPPIVLRQDKAGAVPGHGPARLTWPDLQTGPRWIVPAVRPVDVPRPQGVRVPTKPFPQAAKSAGNESRLSKASDQTTGFRVIFQ